MSEPRFTIRKKADMIRAVEKLGFLPFFACRIPGFSIEEHVIDELWYTSEDDWKVWEWKGPVIRESGCAYGKFFENKAVFITREWFLDFANYRRDGYDFDARYDDGLVSRGDKELYELLSANAPILSKDLKAMGGYGKNGRKGFDGAITRLQALGYVCISDFRYATDKAGQPYGWGIAEYTTPEERFGKTFRDEVYRRTPQESYERMLAHLHSLYPAAEEKLLRKILR